MLSPSIHKFGNEFIPSGLSAALGHEPFGLESFDPELTTEGLMAERLGPNGVSIVLTEDLRIYVTVIANRSTKYERDKEEKRA